MNKTAGSKFGKGQRSNLGMDVDDVPGPGMYRNNYGTSVKAAPSYTMGVNLGSSLATGKGD